MHVAMLHQADLVMTLLHGLHALVLFFVALYD